MDFLFDLLFEKDKKIVNNKKINEIIRYFLIVIISLFFILVLGSLLLAGIIEIIKTDNNVLAGILFLIADAILVLSVIIKIRKRLKKDKKLNK